MAKQVVDRLSKVRCRTHTLSLYATEARDPLARAYGTEAAAIGDRRLLVEGLAYVWGEVDYAVKREMARTLSDVLSRRLRLSLFAEDLGRSVARAVAERMAPLLGWDREETARQIAAYEFELE